MPEKSYALKHVSMVVNATFTCVRWAVPSCVPEADGSRDDKFLGRVPRGMIMQVIAIAWCGLTFCLIMSILRAPNNFYTNAPRVAGDQFCQR